MDTIILAVYVVISIVLIGIILIQHGKGADAGANFGGGSSGASDSLFGSRGSGNFLTKTTAVLATSFFVIALFLSYLSSAQLGNKKTAMVIEQPKAEEPLQMDIPAIPDVEIPTASDEVSTPAEEKPVIPQ